MASPPSRKPPSRRRSQNSDCELGRCGRPSWSPSQIPIPIPSLFAAPGGEGGSRQDPPPLRAVSPRWCGSPHALVYLKYGVTPPHYELYFCLEFLVWLIGLAVWRVLLLAYGSLPFFFFTLFIAYCFELSFIDFLCGFCLVVWLYCYRQRAVFLINSFLWLFVSAQAYMFYIIRYRVCRTWAFYLGRDE